MKRRLLVCLGILVFLSFQNAGAQAAYNPAIARPIELLNQRVLGQAQVFVAAQNFAGAKKAFSRILHSNDILVRMRAPGGQQNAWDSANRKLMTSAMQGYAAAKHANLPKLQDSLKLLQQALVQQKSLTG